MSSTAVIVIFVTVLTGSLEIATITTPTMITMPATAVIQLPNEQAIAIDA